MAQRSLEFFAFVDGKPVSLRKIENANGSFEFKITEENQLKLDDKGRLLIGFEVGPTDEERRGETSGLPSWQINELKLDAAGTTLEYQN